MCSYVSKSGYQCSVSIRQAAKKAFQNNVSLYDKIKTTLRAYTSKRECSVQEAEYLILTELHLRRVFVAVDFVNRNMPYYQARTFSSEKEIENLPDDSRNTFKKDNIDLYVDRLNLLFCGRKLLDSQFIRFLLVFRVCCSLYTV